MPKSIWSELPPVLAQTIRMAFTCLTKSTLALHNFVLINNESGHTKICVISSASSDQILQWLYMIQEKTNKPYNALQIRWWYDPSSKQGHFLKWKGGSVITVLVNRYELRLSWTNLDMVTLRQRSYAIWSRVSPLTSFPSVNLVCCDRTGLLAFSPKCKGHLHIFTGCSACLQHMSPIYPYDSSFIYFRSSLKCHLLSQLSL